MADQKALKKRLKILMLRPENQVCSDCPEKKPTWASLIVAPPGAPPGTSTIGAFCCLECSGSHRRLGVHISFVRSVNLDSWKEHEVQAMENGGNEKVNAIFEARLAQSGRQKPTNLADGPTRERFIRDKYERRKFFDPAGYSLPGNSGGPAASSVKSNSRAGALAGSASDVARQRVASRQARMKTAHSQMESRGGSVPAKPKIASAPVSAPVDLLDFGDFSSMTTPTPAPSVAPPAAAVPDPFAAPAPVSAVSAAAPAPPPTISAPVTAPVPTLAQPGGFGSTPGQEFMTPAPAAPTQPARPPAASNDSIMALFNTPTPQSSYGMQGMGGGGGMPQQMGMMGGGAGMMMNQNNMMMMNQQANPNMMMMNNQSKNNMQGNNQMNNNNNMQQMGGMNPQMMMGGGMNNPQMTMGGMNPQMMAMMQQQQQQQQKQQKQGGVGGGGMMNMNQMNAPGGGGGMGGMNNQNGGANMNNNYNAMMQGMQQMNMSGMGGGQQAMMQQQMNMMNNQQQQMNNNMGMGMMGNSQQQHPQQQQDDGGFGGSMGGGGSVSQGKDPFSSLGGMNAFR